jgi:hypothetical protein
VRLKVVRYSPPLDIEGSVGRAAVVDKVTLEHDRVVARPRHGKRSREPRNPAPGDDELHLRKLSRPQGRQQAT